MSTDLRTNPLSLSWVPVERIRPNTYQVRRTEDPAHVRRLTASIHSLKHLLPETLGLQQPPTARLVTAGGTPAGAAIYNNLAGLTAHELERLDLYAELHFGHSRAAACRLLLAGAPADPNDPDSVALEPDPDYAFMPLFLRAADDATMWKTAVTENAIRADITAVEEAIAILRAVDELGITQADAGAAMGLSPAAAAAKVRLMRLPDAVKAAVLDRHLAESVARALLPLLDAPHLLERLDVERLCTSSRAAVEAFAGKTLTSCPPLPLGDKVPYRKWDYSLRRISATPQQRDQKFDYDWVPADAARETGAERQRAIGPCTGCRFSVSFAVTFNGDGGPRCAQTGDAHAPCYDEKAGL